MAEDRIGIFMRVFRPDPEINNAIKSVLNQTYTNWKFYIVVNEKTEPIVKPYANADSRIQIIFEPANVYKGFIGHAKEIANDGNSYICTLDGDDTLMPNFMEHMLSFSKQHNTDITFCGYYMHGADNFKYERIIDSDHIWSIVNTSEIFIIMYQFFRTIWASLFSSKMIEKCDFSLTPPPEAYGSYGGDTLFIFNCLYFCQTCGYSNVLLYNYNVSQTSASHVMAPGRLNSDQVIFDFTKKFLLSVDQFGKKEDLALHLIYFSGLIDTIELVLNTENDPDQLYNDLFQLLSNALTKEALLYIPYYSLLPYTDKQSTLINIRLFITLFNNKKYLALPITQQYNIYVLLGFENSQILSYEEFRFMALLNNLLAVYHCGNKKDAFSFLLKELPRAIANNSGSTVISILKRLSTNDIENNFITTEKCINANKDLLIALHNKQYKEAIDLIQSSFSVTGFPPFSDELTRIWMLCAAALEDGNNFILAKKVRTEYLADQGRIEEAKIELTDITEMGVEDEDTHYLASLLT